MRSHNGGIDHRVLVVGIVRQVDEKCRQNASHSTTLETRVVVAPPAEPLRQITPRHAHAEFPDHRVNEKTIAKIAVATHGARTAGKQMLDPGELVVPYCMRFHRKPPS